MSTTPLNISLSQLNYAETAQFKLLVKQALANARTASPAFLSEDMDAMTQTVTVQIAIQERMRLPTGQAWWDIPPIVNVPIVLPRGGGFSITLPLKKGDEGMLVFCDTCFDLWWHNGQAGAPLAQNASMLGLTAPSGSQRQLEVRRHHVHDCGFFPGMWSQPNVLSDYSTDSLQIRSDDGDTVIDVSEAGVTVTGNTVTVTSPSSTAGSLVVGTNLELPGVVAVTTGTAAAYLPVMIGGVPYKLLLQPG